MSSVVWPLRNFLRAGVLKKSSWISTSVPYSMTTGFKLNFSPPRQWISQPVSWFRVRLLKATSDTAPIVYKASPRKPKDRIEKRSSKERILLVVCRRKIFSKSSGSMPVPLSLRRIKVFPESLRWSSMESASASRAFSRSSFTTEAGRSMTSPAAILEISSGVNRWTLPMSSLGEGLQGHRSPWPANDRTSQGGQGHRFGVKFYRKILNV